MHTKKLNFASRKSLFQYKVRFAVEKKQIKVLGQFQKKMLVIQFPYMGNVQ